jgi:hypothetical protein
LLAASGIITNTAQINNAVIEAANIKDAAITTAKIDDAAITTAKINDLQVSTIKIQDNAVTIPVAAYTSGGINPTGGTWTTVQSLVAETNDADTAILFSLNAGAYLYGAGESSGDTADFSVRILRDTTNVYQARGARQVIDRDGTHYYSFAAQVEIGTLLSDTNIYLQVYDTTGGSPQGGSGLTFYDRTLIAIGLKK